VVELAGGFYHARLRSGTAKLRSNAVKRRAEACRRCWPPQFAASQATFGASALRDGATNALQSWPTAAIQDSLRAARAEATELLSSPTPTRGLRTSASRRGRTLLSRRLAREAPRILA